MSSFLHIQLRHFESKITIPVPLVIMRYPSIQRLSPKVWTLLRGSICSSWDLVNIFHKDESFVHLVDGIMKAERTNLGPTGVVSKDQ